MSQAAQNLNWLITNFVDNTPGVSHTVVVSADGLLCYVRSDPHATAPTSLRPSPPA